MPSKELMITIPASIASQASSILARYENLLSIRIGEEQNILYYNAIGAELEAIAIVRAALHPPVG